MQEANTYLNLLLEDNENLTNNYTVYNNLMIKIKFKYKNSKQHEVIVSEAEKQLLNQYIDNFRSYATRIKIKFKSVETKIGITQKESKAFFKAHKKINDSPLPDTKDCELFVQIVNDILAEKIGAYEAMIVKESKQDYTDSASAPNIEDDNIDQ